jgi:hypothetical protein
MVCGVATFNVTGILIGLPLLAVGAVIVTVPVYWPTGRAPAFTETCTLPGVVPLAGVAVSHVPPLVAAAATVKLIAPGEPDTVTVCAAGAAPPTACVNVRVLGAAEIVPDVTDRVTCTVAGLPEIGLPFGPNAVTVTVPEYVPTVSLDPSTETDGLLLVVPLAGETDNQFTDPVVAATAV